MKFRINSIKRKNRALDLPAAIIQNSRAGEDLPKTIEAEIFDNPYIMYGAHKESQLHGRPGELLAKRNGAICVGTGDGSLWFSHLQNKGGGVKRKAACMLYENLKDVPELPVDPFNPGDNQGTYREIWIEEDGDVCYINFDFFNGAMSTEQCIRLRKVFMQASQLDHRVIVLQNQSNCWSNGIDLNEIEGAINPADESWANIVAIDDLVREIINCESKIVVSAMAGSAGAGGAIFALAADYVDARDGIVLNPHYKNMGLYGSEYWTYLLPRRVGSRRAHAITEECQPIEAAQAKSMGLVDDCFGQTLDEFQNGVKKKARLLAANQKQKQIIEDKHAKRLKDETRKSLDRYRDEELKVMRDIFYDPESSYHYLRHFFVYKISAEKQKQLNWEVVDYKCRVAEDVLGRT